MKKSTALKSLLSLLVLVILFHICIVVKIIPYEITWGGRLKNDTEMYMFEAISIGISVLLLFVLLLKGEYLSSVIHEKIINAVLWFFLTLFAFNTIGNLFATNYLEKSFSILTLISSFLIWRILKSEKSISK